MAARQDPGFIRNARRVGTERDKVSAHFKDAHLLTLFLRNDVAEDAALFALIVIAAGAKFVEHAARHESGRGQSAKLDDRTPVRRPRRDS